MEGISNSDVPPYLNHYFRHDNNDCDIVPSAAGVSYGVGSIFEQLDSVGMGNPSSSSSSSLLSSSVNPFYHTSNHGTVNPTTINNRDYTVNVPYELGLCERLQRINIGGGGEQKNYCNATPFRVDSASPHGDLVGLNHPSFGGGFNNEGSLYNCPWWMRRGCDDVNDSMGAGLSFSSKRHSGFGTLCNNNQDQIDCYMRMMKERGEKEQHHCNGRDAQVLQMFSGFDSVDMPLLNDGGFYNTQQRNNDGLSSSESFYPILGFDVGNIHPPMVEQKSREFSYKGTRFLPSMGAAATAEELGAFSYEDTLIVEKLPTSVINKRSNRSKVSKKKLKERSQEKDLIPYFCSRREQYSNGNRGAGAVTGGGGGGVYENCRVYENCPLPEDISSEIPLRSFFSSLSDLRGNIYSISKHQHGCRFLQSVFDEGNSEHTELIFAEILPHIVELMMNPFGNYLIQKLLDFCTEEQKYQIVIMLTRRRGELVSICFNSHGTRVVQKLIQSLKSSHQISLLMTALKPGIVELIKDINGNHVVQHCLEFLKVEENKFIFDAATKFCVDIACHRHGCCVLNRCVAFSSGKYREKLVTSISVNSLYIAQDAFGNYVIQQIIELKIPYAAATLLSMFEGHYAYLSMQKFSSHVVEKCLKDIEDSRTRIIQELISAPHFDQLLQDQFANYVIQSALTVSKGSIRAALVEALRPYEILRTNPYCKNIFSRNLFKK